MRAGVAAGLAMAVAAGTAYSFYKDDAPGPSQQAASLSAAFAAHGIVPVRLPVELYAQEPGLDEIAVETDKGMRTCLVFVTLPKAGTGEKTVYVEQCGPR